MPSQTDVHDQLTDIVVQVIGCPADAVVPEAVLSELGTDSLTIVEIGEELGRRFDVYLSDDTIDRIVTVQDAINAVVRHDGAKPKRATPTVPVTLTTPSTAADEVRPVSPPKNEDVAERRGRTASFVTWFALIGIIIGGILGVGGAALVSASGIGSVDLPPINAPTTPTPTKTPSATPSPTETSAEGEPEPTIKVSSTQVSPGEKFVLSGTFPGSDTGEKLQVEVKDGDAPWDDFPINPETRDGGAFKTELYTSRTGERQFRVTNTETKASTPAVTVEIG